MDSWQPTEEYELYDDPEGWALAYQQMMSYSDVDDNLNDHIPAPPIGYDAPLPPHNGEMDWYNSSYPTSSDQVEPETWHLSAIPDVWNIPAYPRAPHIANDGASTSQGYGSFNFGSEIDGYYGHPFNTPIHAIPGINSYVPCPPLLGRLQPTSCSQIGPRMNQLDDLTQRFNNHRISSHSQNPMNIINRMSPMPPLSPALANSGIRYYGRYPPNDDVNEHGQLHRRLLETDFDPMHILEAFDVIKGSLHRVIVDQQGSHLVQSLVGKLSNEQRREIVLELVSFDHRRLTSLCRNIYGSKAVEKLIEAFHLNQYQVEVFMNAFEMGDLLQLMKDRNGFRVIQACLDHLDETANQDILELATMHCCELAIDKYGLCVLKSCISNAGQERKDRLVWKICANGRQLIFDPFGNYAVQRVLKLPDEWIHAELKRQFRGRYAMLARDLYGSNVLEQCLVIWRDEHETIVGELLDGPGLDDILIDRYGNYVIQTALEATMQKGPSGRPIRSGPFGQLCDAIMCYKDVVGNHHFAKRVFFKLRCIGVY